MPGQACTTCGVHAPPAGGAGGSGGGTTAAGGSGAGGSGAGGSGTGGGSSSVGSGAAGGSGAGAAGGSTKGLSKAQIAAGLRVVNGHVVKSLNAGPNKFLRADGLVSATKDIDGIPLPELLGWVLVAAVLFLGIPLFGTYRKRRSGHGSGPTRAGTGGQPVSGPVVRRARRLRRWLVVAAAMVLGVSLLTVLGVSTSTSLTTVSAGAAAACHSDGGLGCTATIPCKSHVCPTLDVAPVSDLVDGQYIYVKATSFPTGDTMRVAICSTSSTISPDPSRSDLPQRPVGGQLLGARPRSPSPRTRPRPTCPKCRCRPSSTHPAPVTAPMPSHDVLNVNGAGKGFYCDDGANPCALEVTEEVGTGVGDGPPDSAANTVDFPLTFRSQSSGCPTE